jgi:hypothetical protein
MNVNIKAAHDRHLVIHNFAVPETAPGIERLTRKYLIYF